MPLKLRFASLSLGASVDHQTGNLSIFEFLEEIRVTQLPVQIQTMVIAICLERQGPASFSGKLLIHIVAPDGTQGMVGEGDVEIPESQKRMKAVFRFGGFPLTSLGTHRFVISWLDAQGAKQGETFLDFDVVQIIDPMAAPKAPAASGEPEGGAGGKSSMSH